MKKDELRYVGKGKIIKRGRRKIYEGTLPFKVGTDVAVLSKQSLEDLLNNSIMLLLAQKHEMSKIFWDGNTPSFSDEIRFIEGNNVYRLFLERKFYSPNLKDMAFIRYVSVDEAIYEGELNGKI